MTNLHASSAARRIACPGSHGLIDKLPDTNKSQHQREGDAAHEVVIIPKLRGEGVSINGVIKVFAVENCIATNGERVTKEMVDGCKMLHEYLDTIDLNGHSWRVEDKLHISKIHENCYGSPDFWGWDGATNLYILDYKFGHSYVEVFENWQLIEYAAGILEKLNLGGVHELYLDVHFIIVQPRNYSDDPIRKWRIKAVDLRPYFNRLEAAEHAAMEPDQLLIPSAECGHCPAKHVCTALQNAAAQATDLATDNSPHELTADQLGQELKWLMQAKKILDARITGLEEEALALLQSGKRVLFFDVKQSNGRERWKKSVQEIIELGKLFGLDLKKPDDVITPKQAIKLGVPENLMTAYSETPLGALKLVEQTEIEIRKKLT